MFLGTPEIAVPALLALAKEGFEIPLVLTNPDRPKGRGRHPQPCPVKATSERLGLPVSHDLADLEEVEADLAVVVAYGQIIPEYLLEKLLFVNLHFSLLPKWRGAAPLERAILNGGERTGICLMALAPTLDTGPIYRQVECEIGADETLEELRGRLAVRAADLLVTALKEGLGEPTPQKGEPTWAKKITTRDRHLDWSLSSVYLNRVVRLGGAWTTFRGKRLLIWKASPFVHSLEHSLEPGEIVWDFSSEKLLVGAGEGTALEVLTLQAEGKSKMDALAWHNGANLDSAEFLGSGDLAHKINQ